MSFGLKSPQTITGDFMLPSPQNDTCSGHSAQISEHNRRLGDHDQKIADLSMKHDAIFRVVTESKESQDRACQQMAQLGLQLTNKLEAMANTQHQMQLDAIKLSTSFALDRENQSTKKSDSRWLIGILIAIPAVINVLITIFR